MDPIKEAIERSVNRVVIVKVTAELDDVLATASELGYTTCVSTWADIPNRLSAEVIGFNPGNPGDNWKLWVY